MIFPLQIYAEYSWWPSCPSYAWKCFPGLFVPLSSEWLKWGWPACCSLGLSSCPYWTDICSILVLRTLSRSPQPFKNSQEWPHNDISQVAQHFWVHLVKFMELCSSSLFNRSITRSSSTKSKFPFLTSLRGLGFLKASLTSQDQGKADNEYLNETNKTLVFCWSFVTRVPVSFSSRPTFSLGCLLLSVYP